MQVKILHEAGFRFGVYFVVESHQTGKLMKVSILSV